MANGGANISRGMGRGAAQVYDTSGPVNMYARLMQQQQLKGAAETKALKDELSKITPEGIRQADVKGFLDQYGRWRDKSIEANAEKNPVRKALLNQEAERERLSTLMYKEDSKDVSKSEDEIHKMLLNPDFKDRFEDKDIQRIINSKTLSKDDSNFIRDYASIQIRPDLSKLTKDLDDLDKNLLQSSQWSAPITEKAKQGNIEGVYVYNTRAVDPKAQATAYASLFDLDRKFQAGLREMFPDLAGLPKEQLKARAIPLLVQQRVRTESSKPDFQANRDDRAYNLQVRRENRLAAGEEGGGLPEDYSVERIQLTTEPQYDKNEEPIIGTEKPSIVLEKSVKTRSVAFPSTQMKAFDVANNKRIVLPARQDLKLARIAYVPTIAKDGRYELQAVVIDSQNKQYVIQETEVPIDIRRTKAYKAAKTALGSPPPSKGDKATITKYSQLQENGISALMEKNKGVTREEIINALIKAGKLPK
jgi:NACalpha-BTF3-like transcription factor